MAYSKSGPREADLHTRETRPRPPCSLSGLMTKLTELSPCASFLTTPQEKDWPGARNPSWFFLKIAYRLRRREQGGWEQRRVGKCRESSDVTYRPEGAAGDWNLLGLSVSVFKTSNRNAFRWGGGARVLQLSPNLITPIISPP